MLTNLQVLSASGTELEIFDSSILITSHVTFVATDEELMSVRDEELMSVPDEELMSVHHVTL